VRKRRDRHFDDYASSAQKHRRQVSRRAVLRVSLFDEVATRPVSGRLVEIDVATLVIHRATDPLVPVANGAFSPSASPVRA
jgi:hypothetical protein